MKREQMKKEELSLGEVCIPIKPLASETAKDYYYFTCFLTMPPTKRRVTGEGFAAFKELYPLEKIVYSKWIKIAEENRWKTRKEEFDLWVVEQGVKQTLKVGVSYANELLEYRDYFTKSIGDGIKTRAVVSDLMNQVGEDVGEKEEMSIREKAYIARTLATTQQMISSSLKQDFELWTTLLGVETLFEGEEKRIEQA